MKDNGSPYQNLFFGIGILIVIGIVMIGLLAMGLRDTTLTIYPEAQDNTLSVTGMAQISVAPDMAEISLGVSILQPTALGAQNAVNQKMNAIVDSLKALGIEEEDMHTSQISLHEEIRWYREEQETVGWRARQTIIIRTYELPQAGPIIDSAISAGANVINSVTFTLSDEAQNEYREQVLSLAGENAKEKAEAIAEGLNVNLGHVKSVQESNYYYKTYDVRLDAEDAGNEVPTVVIPGEVNVSANISVVYTID